MIKHIECWQTFRLPYCFMLYQTYWNVIGCYTYNCWLYSIRSHSPDLWVISSWTCESYQVLCILIWLKWWCCIVNILSNIKMSLVSNIKTRLVSNIKSSNLIEGTLWEWISNCGDDLVLHQNWSLVLYQHCGPPLVEVVILCDILLVMVTECYKSPLGIRYP